MNTLGNFKASVEGTSQEHFRLSNSPNNGVAVVAFEFDHKSRFLKTRTKKKISRRFFYEFVEIQIGV